MVVDLKNRHDKARIYIDSLRNKHKRAYAELYYKNIIRDGHDPDRFAFKLNQISPIDLGYMGAQAVRMRLQSIMRGDYE